MLEKISSLNSIEILKNGVIQVKTKITIMEDGKEISSTFSDHVVAPGSDYSAEDTRVQAVCANTHTEEVIASYKDALIKGV